MALEVVNFDEEVLEASRETPVLVDFWAPWCGPCRVLGPILDKLALENEGRWILAKLNTDENPEVSMRYGIRGIPAVKLFIDGEVVSEFTGALPEYAVRKWLDEILPSADQESLAYAASLVGEGRVREARALLEEMETDEARLLLARLIVFTDPDRACALVEASTPSDPTSKGTAEAIIEVAGVLSMGESDFPEGLGKQTFSTIVSDLRSAKFGEVADGLIRLLQEDRLYADDAARKLGIALFTLLGPEDAVTRQKRRIFDMYLY
jgi:putative thioredoxin